jgi:hypothetical protein
LEILSTVVMLGFVPVRSQQAPSFRRFENVIPKPEAPLGIND